MAAPQRRTRSYGRGSVYYDEKRGAWAFQPPQQQGQRYARSYHATKRAAEVAQENWLTEHRAGIDQAQAGQLLRDWLDYWHAQYVAPDASPSYAEWNQDMIRLYITPALGHHRTRDVTADHIVAWRNMLQKNLAQNTARSVYGVLKRALDQAAAARRIPYNPCASVDPPKRQSMKATKAKRPALTPAQARALLGAVAGHRLEALYALVLLLGLRKGEVLGLRWRDVDFEQATITIAGQVQTVEGRTQRLDRTKTEEGMRALPITPRIVALLRAQWARLQEERRRMGVEWKEHGLVFPSEVGTPISPRNLSTHYYAALARAGLVETKAPAAKLPGVSGPPKSTLVRVGKPIPFHALRHTALTRLAERAAEYVVKGIAGHTPGDVTGGYLHATMNEMRIAIEGAEQLLLAA